jgi:hypothetical protein
MRRYPRHGQHDVAIGRAAYEDGLLAEARYHAGRSNLLRCELVKVTTLTLLRLAVLSICKVTPPASPVRYLAKTAATADRDLTTPKTGGVVLVTPAQEPPSEDAR